MGEMRVMGRQGDTKTIWDPEDEDETQAAREQFDSLTGKGHRAYDVKKDGKQGKRMREFAPDAGKIIFVPPVAGG
jgi:hypothetical protein